MIDKKNLIKTTLFNKHNIRDIRIKRTGESYNIWIGDIMSFETCDAIKTTLDNIIGNYTEVRFNYLKAYNLSCANVRFAEGMPVMPCYINPSMIPAEVWS